MVVLRLLVVSVQLVLVLQQVVLESAMVVHSALNDLLVERHAVESDDFVDRKVTACYV